MELKKFQHELSSGGAGLSVGGDYRIRTVSLAIGRQLGAGQVRRVEGMLGCRITLQFYRIAPRLGSRDEGLAWRKRRPGIGLASQQQQRHQHCPAMRVDLPKTPLFPPL